MTYSNILFENDNIHMMTTIRKFLKDVTSIFSSVPEAGKLIIRAIAAKGSSTIPFAQPVTISTTHTGRRAAIAGKAKWFQ